MSQTTRKKIRKHASSAALLVTALAVIAFGSMGLWSVIWGDALYSQTADGNIIEVHPTFWNLWSSMSIYEAKVSFFCGALANFLLFLPLAVLRRRWLKRTGSL